MFDADTILWVATVGAIVLVLLAVLIGVIIYHRDRDVSADTPAISIGKIALALSTFVATVVAFGYVTDGWMDEARMHELDGRIYQTLAELRMPVVVDVMQVLTWFGSTQAAISAVVILAIYFWSFRNRHQLINLFVVFVPGSAALWALKGIFGRDRPGDALAPTAGHSFPSGHSFTAMILYGFLIYLAWVETVDQTFRVILTALLSVLIVTVAASRIILAAHWASDVFGGLMFGLAWLVSSLMISSITSHIIAQRRPSIMANES